MSWIGSFIWGLVPWWVWLLIGLAAAVGAYRLLGWKGALGVLAVTFGAATYGRGVQKGQTSERAKQEAVDAKARDVVKDNTIAVSKLPPDKRDKEFEEWTLKP